MALPRMPDLSTGNFLVQIDGFEVMSLTAVAGLGFEVQVLEDPESRGNGALAPHRAPGVNKVTVVTLSTMELEKAALLGRWRDEIENGQISRKNASIIMRDSNVTFGASVIAPAFVGCGLYWRKPHRKRR